MKTRIGLGIMLALALALPPALLIIAKQARAGQAGGNAAPARPQGPCDIYAAGGTPCTAAHSSTRALYAAYNGPLYQVLRQSDGKTLDIGVVKPSAGDAGGYADAAAQDAFCANTYCWITTLYDQSGKGNNLVQAPRGGFSGHAMGGFNNVPVADWAPVTIMGHKAYGVFIAPGMGLRWNDTHGTAVDDQAEGQYWVVNGQHYNGGCCYDYGNAETDSRDDGDGTMETTYFGNANVWYHGPAPGPWIMTDQENNLVGCVTDSPNNKNCDLPIIKWRFATAMADGEPHHWRTMGGDAQQGDLKIMFDGKRVQNNNNSYDPMRKQGAILLGNGGDNSNGSQGTFYEGAMTAAGTFPTQETNQKLQANIVAAKYDAARLSVAPASAIDAPPGVQTYAPGASQEVAVTFTNTAAAPASGVKLSLSVPAGWTSVVNSNPTTAFANTASGAPQAITFSEPVAPGASIRATFKVTSAKESFNGDLVANASWTNSASGQSLTDKAVEKVRNTPPVKINEYQISSGTPANSTNSFIELFNAGDSEVDLSGWSLTHHQAQQAIFSSVKVPAGTKLAAKGFYLLGLSNSGLAVAGQKGDSTIYVRSTAGMSVGDSIEVGTGSAAETRKITAIQTPAPAPAGGGRGMGGFGGGRGGAAGGATTVWQPLPDGPVITIPAGSTSMPVTSTGGFAVGQKVALGYGATYPAVSQTIEKYEVVTVTAVGKPGTQAWLSADTKPGDTNVKVSSVANISVGDKIRLGYDTTDHGVEWVTVTKVGTQSAFNPNNVRRGDTGTGLDIAEPLKYHHSMNTPFSARGTGISFEPATKFAHSSNEPVLPLGMSLTLDQPLAGDHEINAVVRDEKVTAEGYQGPPKPNQWFGGPTLGNSGTMVLRDANGLVADSVNFGGVIDPWAAEGNQAVSPGSGNSAPAPTAGGGRGGFGGRGAQPAGPAPNRSAGRFPDGADSDNNGRDFLVQSGSGLAAATAAGANNLKVSSVAEFSVGQAITIDSGENREKAVIQTVGTAGATDLTSTTVVGATAIQVANPAGFSAGQAIIIDSGDNQEKATVASISGGGRGGRGARGGFGAPGGRGARGGMGFPGGMGGGVSITLSEPLAKAHATGTQVSGTGLTLDKALDKAHAAGAQIGGNGPTPGEANQYARRTR